MATKLTKFGEIVREAAGRHQWSAAQLAKLAGIARPNLSKMLHGHRPCGLASAVRLADALNLTGNERIKFFSAADTTTKRRSRKSGAGKGGPLTSDYPAELYGLLVNALAAQGVYPEGIKRASKTSGGLGLNIEAKDGATWRVDVMVRRLIEHR